MNADIGLAVEAAGGVICALVLVALFGSEKWSARAMRIVTWRPRRGKL